MMLAAIPVWMATMLTRLEMNVFNVLKGAAFAVVQTVASSPPMDTI